MAEICREHGISEATYYIWKKKDSGLGLDELRWVRHLREENGKLKRLVADLALDRYILQVNVSKNAARPRDRHELGRWTHALFATQYAAGIGPIVLNRSTIY